jgi:hypothetical protein
VFRADVGDPQTPYSPGPSVALSAGYERRTLLGGSTRMVSSFQSHPELTHGAFSEYAPGGAGGFQILQVASTQQLTLGDAVLIDAGTLMEAERLEETRMEAQPYVRVSVRPSDDVVVEYRFASGRELQSADDLDRLKPTLTVLSNAQGRPLGSKGLHQEISVSRKLGQRVLTLGVFSDHFNNGAIAGSGVLAPALLQGSTIVADPTTGTFQSAAAGYRGRGFSGSLMQPLTPALSAWVEYSAGTALRSAGGTFAISDLNSYLSPQLTQAASVAVRGKIVRTGTSVKAEYRWQPVRTLTQVNAYNADVTEA